MKIEILCSGCAYEAASTYERDGEACRCGGHWEALNECRQEEDGIETVGTQGAKCTCKLATIRRGKSKTHHVSISPSLSFSPFCR